MLDLVEFAYDGGEIDGATESTVEKEADEEEDVVEASYVF